MHLQVLVYLGPLSRLIIVKLQEGCLPGEETRYLWEVSYSIDKLICKVQRFTGTLPMFLAATK